MSETKSLDESSFKRYILKKNLDILKDKKGFHTGLISLTIPHSRKVHDVVGYLKNEISESSNIKSKTNRKNVLDSISAILGKLKLFKEFPENGLVIYSGQVPENGKPGTEQSEIYLIEPPEQISTFKYYCSSEFLLDPLYDMVDEKGTYGIINIENKEAAAGWIRGSKLNICKTFTSGIHGKHSAGGQSQRRLERLIQEGAQKFYGHVAEYSNSVFLEIDDLKGIFVSGAGMTKDKFLKKEVLDYRIRDKVVDTVDVSYSGEAGIRETVIKIQDRISEMRYIKEKKIFKIFMENIATDNRLATYGEKEVRKALKYGAVDVLLLSEDLNKLRVHAKCSQCDYEEFITTSPKKLDDLDEDIRTTQCPSCKSIKFQIVEEKDLVESLGEIARENSSEIEILSTDTEEGTSLYSTFGGIGAILRFKF